MVSELSASSASEGVDGATDGLAADLTAIFAELSALLTSTETFTGFLDEVCDLTKRSFDEEIACSITVVSDGRRYTAASSDDIATVADEGRTTTRAAVVATALLLTFGNPHVYLDTVLTLGAVANAHGPDLRWAFGLGACAASILWFAALGFGAGRLAPWFARPRAWQVLDGVVAVVMITFGTLLLFSVTSL